MTVPQISVWHLFWLQEGCFPSSLWQTSQPTISSISPINLSVSFSCLPAPHSKNHCFWRMLLSLKFSKFYCKWSQFIWRSNWRSLTCVFLLRDKTSELRHWCWGWENNALLSEWYPHLGAELSMDVGTAAPSLFALNLFTWNSHARIQSKGDWGPSIISRTTSKMSLCPTRVGWAKKGAVIYFFVLEFSLSSR